VFERFTERARQVVVLAQDEARALKHNYIGTEHLLLGLLREKEGLASQVLDSLGITLEEMRGQVARIVGHGDELAIGMIPFTPRAKKVLELSLREAISLGHDFIGTEHILLGLARENNGVAARILLDFQVDAETIRNQVIRMLSGPTRLSAERQARKAEEEEEARASEALPEESTRRKGDIKLGGSRMPNRRVGYAVGLGVAPLLIGWLLFGAALGIGILLGWLIWG
jgi:ATP-dependent Clp protease ATP-binding subunit ClpC